jgi:aspartokinase/homoserine dehydrogenase 1
MREKCVCGFSTVDNISLLNIEGTGMIGVPGIAQRLFGALKSANISVMYIAQASSEHSICFATKLVSTAAAKIAVEEAFFYELKQGLVTRVRVIENCSIIAAVGESMSNMPGVSGIFFGALGEARINVLSISQGCDERNISAVVYGKDATRALRAVHSAFWLSSLDLSIGIVGTGRVGSAVLQAIIERIQMASERFGINLNVRGIANSTKMLLGANLIEELKTKMTDLATFSNSPRVPVGGLRRAHSNEFLQNITKAFNEDGPGKAEIDMDQFLNHVKSGKTFLQLLYIIFSEDFLMNLLSVPFAFFALFLFLPH